MKVFKAPRESLGELDAEVVATLVATAADVTLVLDGDGIILDLAFQRTDLAAELESYGRFVGRHFSETVTPDSESKIDPMLREARDRPSSAWRQLNHPTLRGAEVPILYCMIKLGTREGFVAVGRDQRNVALLQQRLIEAQMSMERDYSRLRHSETRYRIMFQVSSEPALIVDATTEAVVEANPAALALFDHGKKRMVGSTLRESFPPEVLLQIRGLLSVASSSGRAQDVSIKLSEEQGPLDLSAVLFRQDTAKLFLIRMVPAVNRKSGIAITPQKAKLLELMESAPDGFVITDTKGVVVTANRAFLEMTQLTSESQARTEPLDRWLGRVSVDYDLLAASLRENRSVKLFATILRGEYGEVVDVEVSAIPVPSDDGKSFGFFIRNVDRRLQPPITEIKQISRSVEQISSLIGRVPLRDLVRQTTDVIERIAIEAALSLTGDNRASAAEMLGLSRQSLYVKLRRYGLADSSVGS